MWSLDRARGVGYGEAEAVFAAPQHPYTQVLPRAAPVLEPRRQTAESALRGDLPGPMRDVPGCPFHPRCPSAFDRCRVERPALLVRGGHATACHLMDGHE